MSSNKTAVFAIFHGRFGVENAVVRLKADGFHNTDISVLFPDQAGIALCSAAADGAA